MAKYVLFSAVLCFLAGCATEAPRQYEVWGSPQRQTREEAERSLASQPVLISSSTVGVVPPKPLETPLPLLPNRTREERMQGAVTVAYFVEEDGSVSDPVVVSSSSPNLAALFMGAMKRWKFEPATKDGKPVRFRLQQSFGFKLVAS